MSAHERILNADAGISKGGQLYHFANKEALVAGLCQRMLDHLDRELEILSGAAPEEDGALRDLTRP